MKVDSLVLPVHASREYFYYWLKKCGGWKKWQLHAKPNN